MLSLSHLILILLILLLLFGAGKLPSVMADLAKGIKSFKKNLDSDDSCESKNINRISPNEENNIDVIDGDISSVGILDGKTRDHQRLMGNKSSSKKTSGKVSKNNASDELSEKISNKVSNKTREPTKSEVPKTVSRQNKKSIANTTVKTIVKKIPSKRTK